MNRTIRTGILSFGMSGRIFHAPLLCVLPGYEISKVCIRSGNPLPAVYSATTVVRTVEEVIEDPDIELVIVNTPDHTHFDFTRRALSAGKHVVVEKPFVLDIQQGEELIALAKKLGKLLTVYQSRRWEGDFMTVKKVIEGKLLGRLVEYEAHFDRFRNFIRDSWKEKPENNTSTLYNLGSHLIDQALVLFGMPQGVKADLRKMRTGAMVDDLFDLNLDYPGLKVTLKGSYLVREAGPRFALHGTDGSFVKTGTDPQEEALDAGRFPNEPGWGAESPEMWGTLNTEVGGLHFRGKVETLKGNYLGFYQELYQSITAGSAVPVDPKDSLNGIRIIRAACESNEKHCRIAL